MWRIYVACLTTLLDGGCFACSLSRGRAERVTTYRSVGPYQRKRTCNLKYQDCDRQVCHMADIC